MGIIQGVINQHRASCKHPHPGSQNPKIMIISCCDSRVEPAIILDSSPGDVFSVRNVANVVPSYLSQDSNITAALEMGIGVLKIKHLIIMGHSDCMGINTAWEYSKAKEKGEDELCAQYKSQYGCVISWMKSMDLRGCNSTEECAKKGLDLSYANCLTYPWVHNNIESKSLIIHRWYFDLQAGMLSTYYNNGYVPL